ncbi:MAG: sigma-70 family RNA polymerase sigma factor [Acidobacteria bacterium]|nr:sigma-70 family RNA polymerase sigma factor [Acidobacteriota bacterium]
MQHALSVARPPVLTFPGRSGETGARGGSLADVLRAVASGDQDAFARLYADYSRMVHAILLGRVPRRDVDDLVQDVFMTAYTRLGALRNPEAFGGWIAAIARNHATDHLRRSHEQEALPDEMPGGDPIEAETLAILDVVHTLPEAYRETLLMRLVEGMSGQEIADRTGLSSGSVRVNLHRGMKLLREKLGAEGYD